MSELNREIAVAGDVAGVELAPELIGLPAVIENPGNPGVEIGEVLVPELLDAQGLPIGAVPAPISYNAKIPVGRDLVFEYGTLGIGDIRVGTSEDPNVRGKQRVDHVYIGDEPVIPTERFWGSVMANFGFAPSVFKFFSHQEVFQRIRDVVSNDRLRYTIARRRNAAPQLLAVAQPSKPTIAYDDLMEVVTRYGGENISYHNGIVSSMHTPRVGGNQFLVGPDSMVNRFQMEVPIDGYGKPCVYLAIERLVCSNGAVARTPMFKTELNLGKGADVVSHAVVRAMDSFNSDEGFAALRQRLETAYRSHASVFEAQSLYKVLVSMLSAKAILPTPEEQAQGQASQVLNHFHQLTGDVSQIYGFANPEAMGVRRQRALPVQARVMDLINFATELATHRTQGSGRQRLHAWVGGLIGDREGYDLETDEANPIEAPDFFAGGPAAEQLD